MSTKDVNMSGNVVETAYWRQVADKCDFNFKLTYVTDAFTLNKDIHATRTIHDNVGSLLEHIKSKIAYYIKDECLRQSVQCDKYMDVNMPISLKLNNEEINKSVVCKNVLDHNKYLHFAVLTQQFKVKLNAPLVQSLRLPTVLYCDVQISPLRFKALYLDRVKSEYFWYKSQDKENWQLVDFGYKYKPTAKDVDHYLKFLCKPKNLFMDGPDQEVISKHKVQEFPEIPKCPFENRHNYTEEPLSGNKFRIVTYNVLSERYCTDDQFSYCPVQYLSVDYRKQLIVNELFGYNADVICMQEVDHSVYTDFYSKKFKAAGYMATFNRKGNKIAEGLACIFRTSRFQLLNKEQIVYSEEITRNKLFRSILRSVEQNAEVFTSFRQQPTSLQLTTLSVTNSNEILLVANTHLYYHSEADHLRLLQLQMALLYIDHQCKNVAKQNRNRRVSVIFCGDFNSNPERAAYELLSSGKVDADNEVVRKIDRNGLTITQPFEFKSACGTPPFTNYTRDFKGCLDYIFYETRNLALLRAVPLPEEEVLAAHEALPSLYFPSDHLALVAELQLL